MYHGQELCKVNVAVAIRIDFVHHILQFGFSWVETERPHHRAELLGCDASIAILVEKREGFLVFCDLLLRQVVSTLFSLPREECQFGSLLIQQGEERRYHL